MTFLKKTFSILAISTLATLSSAFAGTVVMDADDLATLPSCGGVIQTEISNDQSTLNLALSNVVNCSNFDIVSANGEKVSFPNQKLNGSNRARFGSFSIPSSLIELGSNTINIILKSNSGKHSDTVIVTVQQVPSKPIPTKPAPKTATIYMTSTSLNALSVCGGTVQTKVSNRQLNVIFTNVANCSNFDIVGANGEKVEYPNLKLGGRDGARSGSFTLPESVIEYGLNTVRVLLKSNSGQTSELVVISFIAL